jgi:hypothetical protein
MIVYAHETIKFMIVWLLARLFSSNSLF